MKWLYLIAGIAFYFKMLLLSDVMPTLPYSIVDVILKDSGVPNVVSGIILRNRLYDTIFEVIVFTIAIMGTNYLLGSERTLNQVHRFTDSSSIILARLGATIATLVGVELAIRGHLSPGGGFAAGVAGGTAIGLMAMTTSPEWMQQIYQSWHAAVWEKISVLVFIVLSVLTLSGVELPHGTLGTLLSGGIVPVLNALVGIKVALGSWAVVLTFIRYRGLL